VTQNVDGLHQRAGSHGVLEYHGNILRTAARSSRSSRIVRGLAPRPAALRRLRWPAAARRRLVRRGDPARAHARRCARAEGCDVFLSVGTSSLVYPAAGSPSGAAGRRHRDRDQSQPHRALARGRRRAGGPSGILLPRLLAAL